MSYRKLTQLVYKAIDCFNPQRDWEEAGEARALGPKNIPSMNSMKLKSLGSTEEAAIKRFHGMCVCVHVSVSVSM